MTITEMRVLAFLAEKPRFPYELYAVISPNGRFNTEYDCGSPKGGPSRTEYAANNYMGKLAKKGLARRYQHRDMDCPEAYRGKWVRVPSEAIEQSAKEASDAGI